MDGFAFDVSSRLAREQIARQVAASSTYRRQQQQQQSRVCKPMSTGSSPQNLARRREAAGARMYSSPSDAANSARRRAATSAAGRPLSMNIDYRSSGWQGNYSAFSIHDQQASRHSMYEVNNQLGQYQTVAMNGLPTPMTHPELNNMPVDQCFSLDSSPTFPSDYMHLPASDAWQMKVPHVGQVMTPVSNQQAAHAAYPMDYVQSPFAIYQQMLQASASVIGMQTAVQTAPPTPDLFPDQVAEEESEEEDDGPELVGMGLYDTAPGNGGVGALNGGSPTGKTLKLCDAWTPPEDTKSEDGDDDDDEDDEDEDEEEDEEEEQDEEEEEEEDDVEAVTMGATALAGLTGGSWGMTMSQAAWT